MKRKDRLVRLRGAMVGAALVSLFTPADALACGGDPPPPVCAKTVVLGQALRGSQVLTAGGTLSVPLEVFFLAQDVGAPGVCPPGPYLATITFTLTCPPPMPPITGTVTIPVMNGYNVASVDLVLPPGPARICTLTGTIDVLFVDGTIISGNSVMKDVCIVDPAPGNPTLPRLDLRLFDPGSDPFFHVHPGDQARMRYAITNNDPTHTFTGNIGADMEQVSREVFDLGLPSPPGHGPYTISDPLLGDNFPIAFGPLQPPYCVPLPPDPHNPAIPSIVEPLVLLPGETKVIDIFARPWGMCADGSCAKSRIRAIGVFADGTEGVACTAAVVYADESVPPAYLWEDGGKVVELLPVPEPPARLRVLGQPAPSEQWSVTTVFPAAQVLVNGQPQPQTFIDPVPFLPGHGRFQTFTQFTQPFQVDSFFDIAYRIDLAPASSNIVEIELVQMQLVAGAPHGLENFAPMAMGTAEIGTMAPTGGPVIDSFFDVFYQVSFEGLNIENQLVPIEIVELQLQADPKGFMVHAVGRGGPGSDGVVGIPPLVGLIGLSEVRGFARPSRLLFCPGDTNGDATVNFADLNNVLSDFGQSGPGLAGDVNGDEAVNFTDLNLVLSFFGRNCGPTP